MPRHGYEILGLLLMLLLSGSAAAQTPFLVHDINQLPVRSDPREFVEMGGRVYFFAYRGDVGLSLWTSDGTEAGTQLVKQVCQGVCETGPLGLVHANGRLFFATWQDGGFDNDLWTSDGTPTGTVVVRADFLELTMGIARGGEVLFSADDGVSGKELWRSDGTAVGTVMVSDVAPGVNGSRPGKYELLNGDVYFAARDLAGRQIWKTDGVSVTLVSALEPGEMRAVGNSLFVTANDGSGGPGLWRIDPVAPSETLLGSIYAREITAFNGAAYFAGGTSTSSFELWKSDGTVLGTAELADLCPGGCSSSPGEFGAVGAQLFFSADDRVVGEELWVTDGTTGGTRLVRDLSPGAPGHALSGLTAVGLELFFGYSANAGELWRSDGTSIGTVRIDGIVPAWVAGEFAQLGGALILSASNGDYDAELWSSDGTNPGTGLVKDINDIGTAGSVPGDFEAVGGELFLSADDGLVGRELWRTDGVGAKLVKDIAAGDADSLGPQTNSSSNWFTRLGTTLLFAAADRANGTELWRSDGTAAGTSLVFDVDPGTKGSFPGRLIDAGGTVLFDADGTLWRSDGSTIGTWEVAPVEFADPANFLGDVIFRGRGGVGGWEPWRTDGTSGGTSMLLDICPGACSSNNSSPLPFTEVGGLVVFQAWDGVETEPWVSDGTPIGTTKLLSINPSAGSFAEGFYELGAGEFVFSATGPVAGRELWWSDGTPAGTRLLKDINPGSAHSHPGQQIAKLGNMVLFSADDGVSGFELWRSDGTGAGTVLVKDICPGPCGSNIAAITTVGNEVYFIAEEPIAGRELWKSDGSTVGTVRVADVWAGVLGAFPGVNGEWLYNDAGRLYFAAIDGIHGKELWALDTPARVTRQLLRNADVRQVSPLDVDLATILPLAFPRDDYQGLVGKVATDQESLPDQALKPLIFYAIDGSETISLVKTAWDRVQIRY